jgi:hypothetical protein
VVGSSCTWKQDELDLFKVNVERNVDVNQMIPERFFELGGLERYEKCTPPIAPGMTVYLFRLR